MPETRRSGTPDWSKVSTFPTLLELAKKSLRDPTDILALAIHSLFLDIGFVPLYSIVPSSVSPATSTAAEDGWSLVTDHSKSAPLEPHNDAESCPQFRRLTCSSDVVLQTVLSDKWNESTEKTLMYMHPMWRLGSLLVQEGVPGYVGASKPNCRAVTVKMSASSSAFFDIAVHLHREENEEKTQLATLRVETSEYIKAELSVIKSKEFSASDISRFQGLLFREIVRHVLPHISLNPVAKQENLTQDTTQGVLNRRPSPNRDRIPASHHRPPMQPLLDDARPPPMPGAFDPYHIAPQYGQPTIPGYFLPDGSLIGPEHPGFGIPYGPLAGQGGIPWDRSRFTRPRHDPISPFYTSGEPDPDAAPVFGRMSDNMFI